MLQLLRQSRPRPWLSWKEKPTQSWPAFQSTTGAKKAPASAAVRHAPHGMRRARTVAMRNATPSSTAGYFDSRAHPPATPAQTQRSRHKAHRASVQNRSRGESGVGHTPATAPAGTALHSAAARQAVAASPWTSRASRHTAATVPTPHSIAVPSMPSRAMCHATKGGWSK